MLWSVAIALLVPHVSAAAIPPKTLGWNMQLFIKLNGAPDPGPIPNVVLRPSIERDFADPSIIQGPDGWYSFATSNHGVHVQMAYSKDFGKWTVKDQDAMPKLPKWVNDKSPDVWAPDVIRNVCI
jgi:beta-xylosidase